MFKFMKIKKFHANKTIKLGLWIIGIMLLIALLAPLLTPYDPYAINLKESLMSPSIKHPMGTDLLGRDIFTRVLYGSRISLLVGFAAVGISLFIGLIMGTLAGYFGGWVDTVIMRLTDIMLAVPPIVFAIAVLAVLGPGLVNVFLAIGFISWASIARLVRGLVMEVKVREFVEAARSMGASHTRIVLSHILPNCIGPIAVYASLSIASAIISEAAMSFLGLGVQPPEASWGLMLFEARVYLLNAPWMGIFPGLALLITSLGFNLLGDGFRDAVDPCDKLGSEKFAKCLVENDKFTYPV